MVKSPHIIYIDDDNEETTENTPLNVPRYKSPPTLVSILFHELSPKHLKVWKGDPTIMEAYLDRFHNKGLALYLNLGLRKRKTLKKGFTVVTDQLVKTEEVQAGQWKNKHLARKRMKWRYPGNYLQGRECKLKVECNKNNFTVKSVQMGMAYRIKKDNFRSFFINNKTVVNYVDKDGNIHQVPIRKSKNSSELFDQKDAKKIMAIHIQAKKVSKYMTS